MTETYNYQNIAQSGLLPPVPMGYKHKGGGTRRQPVPGEYYLAELSFTDPERCKPFAHFFADYQRRCLDPEIPYRERWILEAE